MSRILRATEQLEDDVTKANVFVHGDEDATYTAKDGAKVRSIRNLQREAEVNIDAAEEFAHQAKLEANSAKKAVKDAESAADAAQISAGVFTSIEAGLQSTKTESFFSVPAHDELNSIILYQNNDGEAVEIKRYPSSEYVSQYADKKIHDLMLLADNVIHDRRGNKFHLAVVDKNNGEIALGFSEKLALIFGLQFKLEEGGFAIHDKYGRTALKINGYGEMVFPASPKPEYIRPALKSMPKVDVIHLVGNGQSLGDGSHSNKDEPIEGWYISRDPVGDNRMLKSGVTSIPELASYDASSLVPLVSMQAEGKNSHNESPIVNSANSLTRRMKLINDDYRLEDWAVVASYGGKGGQSIESLEKIEWQVKKQMSDIARLLKFENKTAGMYFYEFHGNEAQYNQIKNSGTTAPFSSQTADPFMYENKILMHYERIVKHASDVYEQDFLPYLIFGHQVNHAPYKIRRNTIAIAQWRMSKKYPFVILAVPVYRFRVNDRDFQHLHHDQAWLLGEYCGRAQSWTLTKGKWRPLEPISVNWVKEKIDIAFYVPQGELKLDGEAMYDEVICPNFGFDIWINEELDKSAISNIEITSKNSIRIHLAREIESSSALITYGRGREGDRVSGGNLRDSHGDADQVTAPFTNITYKLHNPCVMFQYSRLEGF